MLISIKLPLASYAFAFSSNGITYSSKFNLSRFLISIALYIIYAIISRTIIVPKKYPTDEGRILILTKIIFINNIAKSTKVYFIILLIN